MKLATALALALTPAALALPTDEFDFEDLTPGPVFGDLALAGDHVDVNISVANADFYVENISPVPSPAGWGQRALAVDGPGNGAQPSPMTITFVGGVTGFQIEFGDDDVDTDRLSFEMYSGPNGTGSLLHSEVATWERDFGFDDPGSFLFSFLAPTDALGSVVIDSSGTNGDHSLFYDNLTVYVPAPGTALLALAALTPRRRRR